ncbi:cation transport ATPase [Amycolatopsis granulosa]|nr:cation transport ATPase [Amycolatopsis granulosa]
MIERATPARPARRLLLPEVRWALAALVLFLAGLAADLCGSPGWLSWVLYLGCYAAGGWEPLLAGLRALRERTLDVDLLMVVAAVGAAAIGQVFDGGLLIVIFATSGALEAVATQRTADSVRGLLDLTAGTGRYEIGDEFVTRPGQRIGGDGIVLDGASEVDQSSVTGESMPVPKAPGDEVFAGTLNGTGVLRVGSRAIRRTRCWRGSWRWSRRRPRRRRGPSCSSRRSSSGTPPVWWWRHWRCSWCRWRSAPGCRARCCAP